MQLELIGLCCLCVLLSSALKSQRSESQQAGLFTNTHWTERNVSLDRLCSYCSRTDTDADVYKSFANNVITGSAASSHMRLDASGVCHEEMWAYSGGPAAVCLHCCVRWNCCSHTHSSLFTGLQPHSSCHSVSLVLISLIPAAGVTAHRSDVITLGHRNSGNVWNVPQCRDWCLTHVAAATDDSSGFLFLNKLSERCLAQRNIFISYMMTDGITWWENAAMFYR